MIGLRIGKALRVAALCILAGLACLVVSSPALAAYFDNDVKMDITVYSPSDGVWYILQSTDGYDINKYKAYKWGNTGDEPVPALTD